MALALARAAGALRGTFGQSEKLCRTKEGGKVEMKERKGMRPITEGKVRWLNAS